MSLFFAHDEMVAVTATPSPLPSFSDLRGGLKHPLTVVLQAQDVACNLGTGTSRSYILGIGESITMYVFDLNQIYVVGDGCNLAVHVYIEREAMADIPITSSSSFSSSSSSWSSESSSSSSSESSESSSSSSSESSE